MCSRLTLAFATKPESRTAAGVRTYRQTHPVVKPDPKPPVADVRVRALVRADYPHRLRVPTPGQENGKGLSCSRQQFPGPHKAGQAQSSATELVQALPRGCDGFLEGSSLVVSEIISAPQTAHR